MEFVIIRLGDMKFGEKIKKERIENWAPHYLDYDYLKSLIEGKCGEKEFKKAIEAERLKSDQFVLGKVTEIVDWLKYLSDKLTQMEPTNFSDRMQRVGEEIILIERYVWQQKEGFRKILKRYKKWSGNSTIWFAADSENNYLFKASGVMHELVVELSELYRKKAEIGESSEGSTTWEPPAAFERNTNKYWVHASNIYTVKIFILQHLPILEINPSKKVNIEFYKQGLLQTHNYISSVYMDNQTFDCYHTRINRDEGAQLIRIRWYGGEMLPGTVAPSPLPSEKYMFVERKTHHESWSGKNSKKERFPIRREKLSDLMRGQLNVRDEIDLAVRNGVSKSNETEYSINLASECQDAFMSRKLRPKIRSVYHRTAFQKSSTNVVRISLDFPLILFAEKDAIPLGNDDSRLDSFWSNLPAPHPDSNNVQNFDYGVLEIKISGGVTPEWTKSLLDSGLLMPVKKFSKFTHAIASAFPRRISVIPYWIDQLPMYGSEIDDIPPEEFPQGYTEMDNKTILRSELFLDSVANILEDEDVSNSSKLQGSLPQSSSSSSSTSPAPFPPPVTDVENDPLSATFKVSSDLELAATRPRPVVPRRPGSGNKKNPKHCPIGDIENGLYNEDEDSIERKKISISNDLSSTMGLTRRAPLAIKLGTNSSASGATGTGAAAGVSGSAGGSGSGGQNGEGERPRGAPTANPPGMTPMSVSTTTPTKPSLIQRIGSTISTLLGRSRGKYVFPMGKKSGLNRIKIEPKTFFANERTFIQWLSAAIFLSTISTALFGYSITQLDDKLRIAAMVMFALACGLVLYATFTFHWRLNNIKDKSRNFDDRYGPTALAIFFLTAICIVAGVMWEATLTVEVLPPSGMTISLSSSCLHMSDGTTVDSKFIGSLDSLTYLPQSFTAAGISTPTDRGILLSSSFLSFFTVSLDPKSPPSVIPFANGEYSLTGMSRGARSDSVLVAATDQTYSYTPQIMDYQLSLDNTLPYSTSQYNTYSVISQLAVSQWTGSYPTSLKVAYKADNNLLYIDSYMRGVTSIIVLSPTLTNVGTGKGLSTSATLVNTHVISHYSVPIDALEVDSAGNMYILYKYDRILQVVEPKAGNMKNFTLPGNSSVIWDTMALQELPASNKFHFIYLATLSYIPASSSLSTSSFSPTLFRFSFSPTGGFLTC